MAEGLSYFWRWQTPVCALIIALPASTAAIMVSRAKYDPLPAVDLWVPCWRNLHPLWLLGYRVLVFLSMSWLLSQMILLRGAFTFYFYTQWTFTLVIIYFAIASSISAHGWWICSKNITKSEDSNGLLRKNLEGEVPVTSTAGVHENQNAIKLQGYIMQGENSHKAGFWGCIMHVVYQTSAGAVMMTDIVFWGLLVPFLTNDNFKLNLVMACMHSLNAVFLLLDGVLNRLPFPGFGMAYFVLWSAIYITFQWILHACGFSWWPYPFLELATPWAPIWYFCLALVHIPCYYLFFLIFKAKNSLFPKIFPHAYLKAY